MAEGLSSAETKSRRAPLTAAVWRDTMARWRQDSFGSRQLLFEMHHVGSAAANKLRLATTYDTSAYVSLARELAGISSHTLREGN